MITHQLEAEINGIETNIEVDYEMAFGQPAICCIMNLETKEVIDVEEITDVKDFDHQLSEWAMNVGQVYLDHEINN